MHHKRKSRVPLLLTIIIGCFILFLAWSGKQASVAGTDVTDRDYYSKGLKYNSTLVEKKAAKVIGWRLQTKLTGRNLTFNLSDKNSQQITAASGQLILPKSPGNPGQSLQLVEEKPGIYQVELPTDLRGEQLAQVNFELNGARTTRQLLLNISDSSRSQQNE